MHVYKSKHFILLLLALVFDEFTKIDLFFPFQTGSNAGSRSTDNHPAPPATWKCGSAASATATNAEHNVRISAATTNSDGSYTAIAAGSTTNAATTRFASTNPAGANTNVPFEPNSNEFASSECSTNREKSLCEPNK